MTETKPNTSNSFSRANTNSSLLESKWFAFYTRSRFEKQIQQNLQKSKIQTFLPMTKVERVWSDRLKTVQVPLLPGYVFFKLPIQQLHQVSYHPGVVRVVSIEGKPCEIPEREISLLEKIAGSGLPVSNAGGCKIGEKVQIIRGPLKGWEGSIAQVKGHSSVVFRVDSIQQMISVEVSINDISRAVKS